MTPDLSWRGSSRNSGRHSPTRSVRVSTSVPPSSLAYSCGVFFPEELPGKSPQLPHRVDDVAAPVHFPDPLNVPAAVLLPVRAAHVFGEFEHKGRPAAAFLDSLAG